MGYASESAVLGHSIERILGKSAEYVLHYTPNLDNDEIRKVRCHQGIGCDYRLRWRISVFQPFIWSRYYSDNTQQLLFAYGHTVADSESTSVSRRYVDLLRADYHSEFWDVFDAGQEHWHLYKIDSIYEDTRKEPVLF